MRIAAVQLAVTGDIPANLREMEAHIRRMHEKGSELIVFPECCLTGYPPHTLKAVSDVSAGAVTEAIGSLQRLVDTLNVAILFGSIVPQKGKYSNSAVLLRPRGEKKAYSKRTLWGWDRDNFIPGCESGVFDLGGLRIGVRICYEIRFPELFRELYRGKTDINIVLFYDVSEREDKERYEIITSHLRTRAAENVTPVVSVNTAALFQTAPTAVFGKSGELFHACDPGRPGFLLFDFEKTENTFSEQGRTEMSDILSYR